MQSWVSGFAIHLRIGLSETEGDAFLGALEVDQMEDHPVVKMEGDMEVVDVRICVVSILRFFVIDPFMIVFPTVFISYLSDDLSFVQIRSLSLMY